jgi:hypothetical protein
MMTQEIIERCTSKFGMSLVDARWVAERLYDYAMPDFSEWSWSQIDECFKDVLWFKRKTDAEIKAALA